MIPFFSIKKIEHVIDRSRRRPVFDFVEQLPIQQKYGEEVTLLLTYESSVWTQTSNPYQSELKHFFDRILHGAYWYQEEDFREQLLTTMFPEVDKTALGATDVEDYGWGVIHPYEMSLIKGTNEYINGWEIPRSSGFETSDDIIEFDLPIEVNEVATERGRDGHFYGVQLWDGFRENYFGLVQPVDESKHLFREVVDEDDGSLLTKISQNYTIIAQFPATVRIKLIKNTKLGTINVDYGEGKYGFRQALGKDTMAYVDAMTDYGNDWKSWFIDTREDQFLNAFKMIANGTYEIPFGELDKRAQDFLRDLEKKGLIQIVVVS